MELEENEMGRGLVILVLAWPAGKLGNWETC
jgi:hypothetical protein